MTEIEKTFEHLHTERAILACIFKKPDLLIDLDGVVAVDAFKSPVNRSVMQATLDLYELGYSKLDAEMVYNKLLLSPVAGLDTEQLRMYLNSLYSAEVYIDNFKTLVSDLADVDVKERVRQLLHSSLDDLYRTKERISAGEFIVDLQNNLFTLEGKFNAKNDEPRDVCSGIRDRMVDRVNHPNDYSGIPSGMQILDDITMGWLKTKFYFVAARPKTGKSSLLSQWAYHAAFFAPLRHYRVLYLDTEIKPDEFECRMVGHISAVDHMRLMQGDWYQNQQASENIITTLNFLEKNQGILYHKYIPNFKIASIVSLIKKYVYNHGIDIVFFDYIKEPDEAGDRARWQKIGDLARALKNMGGELDIPVLSALQQNRKGEGQSRTGGEAYGESDDVLKECDAAFMLNWKSHKEMRDETLRAGTHRFQIERARYVKSFYNGINFRFYGYCLRFVPSPIQNLVDAMTMPADHREENVYSAIPQLTEEKVETLVLPN